jgi:hypothetical protein
MLAGLAAGMPPWLQMTGWFLFASYLVGGSIYLVLHPNRNVRQTWGEIGLLPPRLRRWLLDEPDPESRR